MSAIKVRLYHQQGVALVLVLWMLALLTVMTMGYSTTMRTETRLISNEVQIASARALAQGGIWYATRQLLANTPDQQWLHDGTPRLLRYAEAETEIRVYDEAGKIDLNSASAALLLGLLRSAGLGPSEALQMLHAIEDWRDPDDEVRTHGAENAHYYNVGLGYGAKNGPFNSVGELRQVLGMTESLFRQIAPALTVYSHRSTINPEAAPPEALLALPGIDPATVMEYLQARSAMNTRSSLPVQTSNHLSRAPGNTFTIVSTGISGSTRYTTSAVILLKQHTQFPFSVLSWSEAVAVN